MEDRSYKKNRMAIALIAIAGMSVYLLPFFHYYYYDAYKAYFAITDSQMGVLGSVFGALSIFGYIFGGYVADRFNVVYSVSGSLVVTGLSAFLLMIKPAFPIHAAIYAVWGITSILTFWNPAMKAIRALCKADEQGRGFALFDMVRGILNFASGVIILAIFTKVAEKIGQAKGLLGLIAFYGIEAIIVGVLCFGALKKAIPASLQVTASVTDKEANVQFFKNVLVSMKKPTTWCVIVMMFMTYGVIITYNMVVPYCTAAFGMSAALAGIMGYAANGFRFVGCWLGGNLADRHGISNMVVVDVILMVVGVLGLLYTPRDMKFMWMLVVSIGILCSFMYSCQALHYAILEEGNYPVEIMGATTFVLSPIGYGVAESIMPAYNGMLLDRFEGLAGYEAIFKTYLVMLAIALVAMFIFRRLTKERRAEIAAMRKADAEAKAGAKKSN